MVCQRCQKAGALREVTFAPGKKVRKEGDHHYFEGPTVGLHVCDRCFLRFHGEDPMATKINRAVFLISVVAAVGGLVYPHLGDNFRSDLCCRIMANFRSPGVGHGLLLKAHDAAVLVLGGSLIALFYGIPAWLLTYVLASPFWFPTRAIYSLAGANRH